MAERVEVLDEEGEPVLPKSAGSRASARKRRAPPSPQFPATNRKMPLNSLEEVAAEMARVYRACARAEIDTTVGTKLVYQLRELGQLREATDLERRIAALEALGGPDAPMLTHEDDDDDEEA